VRVLVVEDDAALAESVTRGLRRHGYDTECVDTGIGALRAYHRADLMLLNLELPDIDGLEVCRNVRAAGDTAIISVAQRGTEVERVLGLQAGSDDCLTKPYGFRELLARIEAVMRRVRPVRAGTDVLRHGELLIDRGAREVRVGERPIAVTRKEFDLLTLLAAHPDRVFSRKEVMAKVWDDIPARPSRTIDTHVSTLRNKLGGGWIVTVRGVGFRLGRG
jgi:DNA-binding response OmpR family regulator